jgi:putative thiamine transport system permease protein
MRTVLGALPILTLWVLPLIVSLALILLPGFDGAGWDALMAHPQLWPALALSLITGLAATGLALLCALIVVAGFFATPVWHKLQAPAAAGLALPHLAFAMGFGFLIMPSGFLARLFVGGDRPPAWITTQDPWGIALFAALAVKEVPFLLAMIWSILSDGALAARLNGESQVARSLGHGLGSVWLRVVQPQILRKLAWPLVVVFSYSATVVDMALVLGPTQPPTFAVVVWHDLNAGEPELNARGLAGALCLTLAVSATAASGAILMTFVHGLTRPWLSAGPSRLDTPRFTAVTAAGLMAALFSASLLMLAVFSMAPRWPYPNLWPSSFSAQSWSVLAQSSSPLWLSLGLGAVSAVTALLLAIVWFETQPAKADRWLIALAMLALALPPLAVAAGQYRMLLPLGLTGHLLGLFLVHLAPATAYVLVVLMAPYRGLDPRYMAVARSLSESGFERWWRIKMPLLKGPVLTAAAVGFSVSMVQYASAQLVASGRFATLPVDAVTLASGGNRSLAAAYALALALPPLVAFAIAAFAGRPRWR